MRIRWIGPGLVRRIVAEYEWSQETGFVQDIPAGLAAELLTAPDGLFVVDGDDPLNVLIGDDPRWVAELALAGIGSPEELAELSEAGIKRLAKEMGVSQRQVRGWRKKARRLVGQEDEGQEAGSQEVESNLIIQEV